MRQSSFFKRNSMHTQHTDNDQLDRWAATKTAPKGRGAHSTDATPRMLRVLNYLRHNQGSMQCGKFYGFDTNENGIIRLPIDMENQILRLYRRGFLQRMMGGKLLPTEKGNAALKKFFSKSKPEPANV